MSSISFYPARLPGSAAVPPAKSEAHRTLLLAALGSGPCRLNGFSAPLCDDTPVSYTHLDVYKRQRMS